MSDTIDTRKENIHRFEHRAMATIFEILIADEDLHFAHSSAFAAFQEIDRLEQELSRYLPNSDIARINNLPPHGKIRVSFDAFQCLSLSLEYWKETEGAFDVAIGRMVDGWKGRRSVAVFSGEPERAKEQSGMHLLELDEASMSVGVGDFVPLVDLGAIGKGYAVDRGVELLKEWGVSSALVHGGMSSAFAFGDHAGERGWSTTLSSPGEFTEVIQKVVLKDQGLGGSGTRKGLHIADPRTGEPVDRLRAAWVCSDAAAKSDAISTACMVMTPTEIQRYIWSQEKMWAIVFEEGEEGKPASVLRCGPGIST